MDEINQLRKEILESDTFCFYPYLELSTNPAGYVRPCCYWDGYVYKDTKDQSWENVFILHEEDVTLERVWNSEDLKNIRKDQWNGKQLKPCQVCHRDAAAGMRERSVKEYKNNVEVLKLVKDTIDNNFFPKHLPTRLELKPSSLCNLKCVMCTSYDSSQIEKEIIELADKYSGIEVQSGRFIKIDVENPGINEQNPEYTLVGTTDYSDKPDVWDSFCKMAPHLETLSFAGGEPTLLPFVEQALRYCVENGYSKNITVFCSSNFTNLNKSFLELMPQFKMFELIASIDGYQKVQEYTRFPSKWSQIEKNYKAAKEMMKHGNVKLVMNITVHALNVLHLDELLSWVEERAQEYPYFNQWPFNFNLLWSPHWQQIPCLPRELKDKAIAKLEAYKLTSKILKDFPEMTVKIDLVINELKKPDTALQQELMKKFGNIIRTLDSHRCINIGDYIPELKDVYYKYDR